MPTNWQDCICISYCLFSLVPRPHLAFPSLPVSFARGESLGTRLLPFIMHLEMYGEGCILDFHRHSTPDSVVVFFYSQTGRSMVNSKFAFFDNVFLLMNVSWPSFQHPDLLAVHWEWARPDQLWCGCASRRHKQHCSKGEEGTYVCLHGGDNVDIGWFWQLKDY